MVQCVQDLRMESDSDSDFDSDSDSRQKRMNPMKSVDRERTGKGR